MEPATTIIASLGGLTAVADILGVTETTVRKWTYERGMSEGTGGVIPQRHIVPLIAAAEARGVTLTLADFFPAVQGAAE